MLTLHSPAKLNLFLLVTGRRDNGYHELQTLFQLLDYSDELGFELTTGDTIEVEPQIPGVKVEDNLVHRAAKLLHDHALATGHTATNLSGVRITLKKQIPMGGGLGGGSSNAATTLLALNDLWCLNLPREELAHIGLSLGADVPVFVEGFSAFAEGVGEELEPVEIPEKFFVVMQPNCHVSTAEIFSHQRLTRDTPKIKIAPALEGGQTRQALDASSFDEAMYQNDCTGVACELYPEIGELLNYLKQFGDSAMTGTGSCCFCTVDSLEKAHDILQNAPKAFTGFVAKGVNQSLTLKELDEARQLATS